MKAPLLMSSLVAALAVGALAQPAAVSAAGIKFLPGHYTGTLDNNFGTVSFTAKKTPRLTGGRLNFNVPAGQGCPEGQGEFSGYYSFKADMNRKGFFSVSGSRTIEPYGDVLTSSIQGRVRKDGTASGKAVETLDVQPGGSVPSPFTCHFEVRFSAVVDPVAIDN
jgi:hypothetical protein